MMRSRTLRPLSRLIRVALAGVAAVTALVGLATPAPAQQAPARAVRAETVALRPGDAIRLKVWREPDLTGDYMVDEGSLVTLPRLGRVSVAGLPIDTVRARVIRGYAEILSTIAGSSVEVTPLFRIHVVGAVRNPGLYSADPTMTVADALGLAGGVSAGGRANRVILMRDGRPSTRLARGARLVELALRSGDELYVPQGAWLGRNAGLVFGAVSAAASVLWAVQRRD